MLETVAIKIAHYDFTDKQGKKVCTSKLIVSLGDFGTITLCSPLANEYPVFSKVSVAIENKDNKIVIKSIKK